MSLQAASDNASAGAPLERSRAAVILLHGRGASPASILSLARLFPSEKVHSVAPAAPGGVWYPQRFLAPIELNQPWLDQALERVHEQVREAKRAGIPLEQIALVGFSQGACLALEYAARHPARYFFIAGLSGALIGPLGHARPLVDLKETPVLLSCAEEDAHIPKAHVEESARWFEQSGAKVTLQLQEGGIHSVFPEGVEWLRAQNSRIDSANTKIR